MKIIQLTYSKNRGGASKACLRLHRALVENNIDSTILTCLKPKDKEKNIRCLCNTLVSQAIRKFKKVANLLIAQTFQKTSNHDLHTFDIGTVVPPRFINKSDVDIVHLHWINYSMIGIKALGKVKKKVVWTFHDMWPFMGCEHYDNLNSPERYAEGYTKQNKNVKGLDLNRIAWKMKQKHWKNLDLNIVVPSNWLKTCVEKSTLFKNTKVTLIPYIIEEDKFYTIAKGEARKKLSLENDKKYILFGAFNANNLNKGGDLLYAALENLEMENTELVVFGASSGADIKGIKTHYLGYISDEATLNLLYNAADLMVVPSRQDNLPNTVLESICCGTPVVGFNIGGLLDMIAHKKNGYLAQPFDVDDLNKGISYILTNGDKINFRANCRKHFEAHFSQKVVIPKLIEFYNQLVSS